MWIPHAMFRAVRNPARAVVVLVVLALLLPTSPANAQDPRAPFTPLDIAKLRWVTEAAVSPDGSRIAYVLSVPRSPGEGDDGPAWAEMHVLDPSGASRPYVSGEVNVQHVAWWPGHPEIAFLMKRGKGDDEHTSLWAIPVDGGEAHKLLSFDTDISSYSFSPDGKQVAFLAKEKVPEKEKTWKDKGFDAKVYEESERWTRVWVAALDPEGSPPRMLALEGSASALHWSPRGNALALALAPSSLVDDSYTSRRVFVVDSVSGAITGRMNNVGKLGAIAWSPDGSHLAFISSRDEFDPADGRLTIAPASGEEPRQRFIDYKGQVVDIAWKDADTVLYVAHEGVWSVVGEAPRSGSDGAPVVPAGRAVFDALSLSRDGRVVALLGSSPGHPTELFTWKPGDPEPARATDSNPWLAERRLAPQEVVTYKARDGLEIQGLLIRPLDAAEGKRHPLVLVVHGGPESHYSNDWLTGYSTPAQVLAARGFALFYPNYRGSTGRGLEFAKLSQGDAAGKEFDDFVDGVDHLVAIGVVDRDRVGITGGSYGGYASAWGATFYSDRFAASVMFVGISNKLSKWGETDIPDEEYYAHALEHIWDDWQKYLERSPVYHAGKSHTPTLILHGDSDPRVHPSQSMELYRHLKHRGQAPVRLVFYPGEGHGNRRAASRYDYTLRMLRWMEHYLKGPGGDPPPFELDYAAELGMQEEE